VGPSFVLDTRCGTSYGSVYGAVIDSGRRLYVADAMQMREMAFSLGDGPVAGTAVAPDPALRKAGSDVIRDTVLGLARLHGFSPERR